jgi:ArsR family transcriptional regulator
VRRGDLGAIPIDSGACDAALLVLVLAYLEDPASALTEMSRILKPGGQAIIIDLLPHTREDYQRRMLHRHPGFSAGALSQMMVASGLGSVEVVPLMVDAGAKGPALFLATASRG